MMANKTLADHDLFSGLEQLIHTLEQQKARGVAGAEATVDGLLASLREQQSDIQRAVDEFESKTGAKLEQILAARDPNENPRAPTVPEQVQESEARTVPRVSAKSTGDRVRREFLAFLKVAPSAQTSRPSANFSDWALGSIANSVGASLSPASASGTIFPLALQTIGDRKAVWIGLLTLVELAKRVAGALTDADLAAMEHAARWVVDPTDAHRDSIVSAARATALGSPAQSLGAAVAAAYANAKTTSKNVLEAIHIVIDSAESRFSSTADREDFRRFTRDAVQAVASGNALWSSEIDGPGQTSRVGDSWYRGE